MPFQNDATASYLGYLFQGQYALLALWDANDADVVSVETEDDVVLEGSELRLVQLKHTLFESVPPLRIGDVGFWKSIRIWVQHQTAQAARGLNEDSDTGATRYLFVTVAVVGAHDPLVALIEGSPRDRETLAEVTRALTVEAARVRDERASAREQGRTLPYSERSAACEAFLALDDEAKQTLVGRIVILPATFRITNIAGEVQYRLRNHVRASQRSMIAERLIERWDRLVGLALMRQRSRRIAKEELTDLIQQLIEEHGPEALTNDFGRLIPSPAEVAADAGGNIERQIVLVEGGSARVNLAIRDRWRARNQRERWMADDASLVPILKEHDDALKEAWADVHGPMCDDCRNLPDEERRSHGLGVLDWAHTEAVEAVEPPRRDARHPFYVRGMLHQFADDLEIGWHPAYAEALGISSTGVAGTPAGGQELTNAGPNGADLRDALPPNTPLGATESSTGPKKRVSRPRRARNASAE